jgi:hypothetical protein
MVFIAQNAINGSKININRVRKNLKTSHKYAVKIGFSAIYIYNLLVAILLISSSFM